MKILRRRAGHTFFDYKRSEEILEGLKIEPLNQKGRIHKQNWLRHVTRMKNNSMPNIIVNYRPHGRRRVGRPLKRLLDEPKTGIARSNSQSIVIVIIIIIVIVKIFPIM
jgi:hypothetical protein